MADVSKLARARLAKATVAGPHPDADLLAAFAERTAMPAEREQVLAHLATCAECREVVALAAPEAVPLEQPVLVSRRPWWLRWQVLQWGAVGASVAIVAVVVFVESPKYAPKSPVAQVDVLKQKQDTNASFASNEAKKTEEAKTTSAPTRAADGKATPAQPQPEAYAYGAGPAKKELSPTAEMDKLAAAPPAPAPVQTLHDNQPATRSMAKTQSGSVGGLVRPEPMATTPANRPAENEVAAARKPAGQPVGETAANADLAKSAPARDEYKNEGYVTAQAAPAAGAGRATGMSINGMREDRGRMQLAAYRWTVTSDGRVQRSADGRTWFFVPVADNVRFRALASDGGEVWAGGDRGALYHSTDAGENWKKVPLERVSGDIIRLVINSDTVVISTSSGQTISMSHNSLSESPAKPNSPR